MSDSFIHTAPVTQSVGLINLLTSGLLNKNITQDNGLNVTVWVLNDQVVTTLGISFHTFIRVINQA